MKNEKVILCNMMERGEIGKNARTEEVDQYRTEGYAFCELCEEITKHRVFRACDANTKKEVIYCALCLDYEVIKNGDV